jgi:hypothetical protein
MPKKLKKLIWLLEHIPSLIKAHNGLLPLFRDTLVLMKKIGVRSAFGLFIGQVAYERRNNADAYRQWIRITENKGDEPGLDYEGILQKHQAHYLFLLQTAPRCVSWMRLLLQIRMPIFFTATMIRYLP